MKKIYFYAFLNLLVSFYGSAGYSQIEPPGDPIIMNPETIQIACNGIPIGNPVSLVANDTLLGLPVVLGANGNVVLTVGALPSGISVDVNTGMVSVSPNINPGTYSITYTLCKVSNPAICETIVSTVVAYPCNIQANDDMYDITLSPNGGITPSILLNDIINGFPATANNVVITPLNFLNFFGLNPDGSISIAPNTPTGTYLIDYQICEINNPNNCDTASIILIINGNNQLTVNVVGTYSDYNNDGFTNVGDIVTFQISITNPTANVVSNIVSNGSSSFMPLLGNSISSIGSGQTNSTEFSGIHIITQADINQGYISDYACFIADGNIQGCFDANSYTLNSSNGIKLNAFIDSNNNGTQESNEQNFPYGNFNYSVNGGTVNNLYSWNGMVYLYESNPSTSYNLSYTVPNLNTVQYSCNTTYSNITVAAGSGITTYNFPITVIPHYDVAVYLYSFNNSPRPGFQYANKILLRNNSNLTIPSGTLTFTKNSTVSIASIVPNTITPTATGFTHNYTNLLPYESRYIYVYMTVPTIPTVALGQLLTNTASVSSTVADVNPTNNTANLTQTIVGSWDPNDKQESHGGKILHSAFTANDYLNYTIRFENTGTAEAINVKVTDVLDAKLDETSIKMVDASSSYILDRVGNNLSWSFDGINLPPSNGNGTVGHGYINFQIKPKPGFAVGDIIPNTANIYFDFNPAIVTNTCTTEFVSTLANETFTFDNFKLYPNPVKNTVSISNNSVIDTVEIYSIVGQKMLSKQINSLATEVDLSQLSNGIYFVKINSEGSEKTVKIVKE